MRTFGMGTWLPETNLEEMYSKQDVELCLRKGLHTAHKGSDLFLRWGLWGRQIKWDC